LLVLLDKPIQIVEIDLGTPQIALFQARKLNIGDLSLIDPVSQGPAGNIEVDCRLLDTDQPRRFLRVHELIVSNRRNFLRFGFLDWCLYIEFAVIFWRAKTKAIFFAEICSIFVGCFLDQSLLFRFRILDGLSPMMEKWQFQCVSRDSSTVHAEVVTTVLSVRH